MTENGWREEGQMKKKKKKKKKKKVRKNKNISSRNGEGENKWRRVGDDYQLVIEFVELHREEHSLSLPWERRRGW